MTKINSLSDREAVFNAQRDELIAVLAKALEGYVGEPVTYRGHGDRRGYFLINDERLVPHELWGQVIPQLMPEILSYPFVKSAVVDGDGTILVDFLSEPVLDEIVLEVVV